jgi:hypothetical protein
VAFDPVALVYDVDDTKGTDLPDAVAHIFTAIGEMNADRIQDFINKLKEHGIDTKLF